MIVIFAARAACSTVTIWFLHQLGHLKAACEFHPWPHQYRLRVYYRSQLYAKAYGLDLSNFSVVRVVRDPFARAASSYRHALLHGYLNAEVAKLHQRNDVDASGYSFADFLDVLEQLDLTSCDIHCRIQRHPIEDRLPVRHLINVSTEDLLARLNEVAADLQLAPLDFAARRWIRRVDGSRTPRSALADLTDLATRRFNAETARHGPWAPGEAFLTPAIRQRLARLYAVDIAAYVTPRAPEGTRTAPAEATLPA
jgi:hypothetical protein